MYCVKCGVELADSEKSCPLCGTKVICPDAETENTPSPYPPYAGKVTEGVSKSGILFIVSVLFLIPFLLCLICDYKINGGIIWSGYASGAVLLGYITFILPAWFKRPNPVIFAPADFAASALYLHYINEKTGGNWFLSLALPIVGTLCLLVTAVVALTRYVKGGRLYIYGGATIFFGGLNVLAEFLIYITFPTAKMFVWSLYPLSACFILGMMLIVIAICKPLKESLRRKLFF